MVVQSLYKVLKYQDMGVTLMQDQLWLDIVEQLMPMVSQFVDRAMMLLAGIPLLVVEMLMQVK
jgi:hypothetical protein